MKGVLASVLLLATLCLVGCGGNEPASQLADAPSAPADLKALWRQLVPEAAWTFESSGEMVSEDGDKTTVVHRVPLLERENERGEHLEGIELPENATKQEVRKYVARILGASIRARCGAGSPGPAPPHSVARDSSGEPCEDRVHPLAPGLFRIDSGRRSSLLT